MFVKWNVFCACLCEQGLIPEISAGEIAAEDPVLAENVADDREDGEMSSPASEHRDIDIPAEDTRTTKIRRVVYVCQPASTFPPGAVVSALARDRKVASSTPGQSTTE